MASKLGQQGALSPEEWKRFQDAVASIERVLGNRGYIESPAYVKNPRTGRRREIDVLIYLKEGPRDIRIAIECRKRKYKSDVTWIEQLVGKRDNLGIDHMVAVSASSFSPEAIEYAKGRYIELMELSEFYNTEWKPWLECEHILQIERGIGDGSISLYGENGQPIQIPVMDGNSQIFRNDKGEMLSFTTLWNNNSDDVYSNLTPNTPPQTLNITITVPECCAVYVQLGEEWCRVATILLNTQVWIKHHLIPLRPAVTYRDVLKDQVVLGYTETAVPIKGPDGKMSYVGFAKVPTEDSPPGTGKIAVIMRNAE